MIRTIAKREFLEKILDFRVVISFVIAIVLAVVAALVAGAEYHTKKAEYDMLVSRNQARIHDVKVYSQFKPAVYLPPSPLSVFDKGTDIPTPITVDIDISTIPRYQATAAGSNPMMRMFDSLDIATVIRILFSLLVILLTFDSFSGEKENGTLRQTLSNPVPRLHLLYGKFLGVLLVLVVVVLLTFLTALISLGLSSSIGFQAGDFLRILLIALATIIYLAFFVAVGMLASVWFHHSSTSLAVLLIVWFFLAIFQPNLNTYVVSEIEGNGWLQSARKNLQSSESIVGDELARLEKERGGVYHDPAKHAYYQGPNFISTVGYGDFTIHPAVTDADYDILQYEMQLIRIFRKFGETADRDFEKYRTYYESHLNKQLGLKRTADIFSPASLFSRSAAVLARTDIDNVEDFYQAARQYRSDFLRYLDQKGVFSDNAQLYFSRLKKDQIDPAATAVRMEHYSKDPNSVPYLDNQPPLDLSDAPAFAQRQSGTWHDIGTAAAVLAPVPFYFAVIFILTARKLLSYDPR